jgi:predicted PurR-regulated permease PerM
MNSKLTAGWVYGPAVVLLALWILQSFLLPILVACVTAAASWPLYRKLAERLGGDVKQSLTALMFTALITTFVLAPLAFSFGALATELHTLLLALTDADKRGIAPPQWLERLPLAGQWLAARWDVQFAHPGALVLWTQRADPAALLAWAQSLGRFMARHAFIMVFTMLLLFFLYRQGESIADEFRRLIRYHVGQRAEAIVDIAIRALRASVNSMLLVALFDGVAVGVVYAILGVPHAAVWAAITGSMALVPFMGYAAVAVLALQLAITNATASAFLACALACAVLFCGDKILRPTFARAGTRLPFIWVLMGCLGGFEVLGLVGLVIGPIVLTLAAELWDERIRDLDTRKVTAPDCLAGAPDVPRSAAPRIGEPYAEERS